MNKDLIKLSTPSNIIKFARETGIPIFENNSKDCNLNIWVIRSDNQTAGYFDDLQVVFWKDLDNVLRSRMYSCTADPSEHYLLNPINSLGTAIVKPGHYSGVWSYGYHKNRSNHPALVQVKPLTIIRDFNKDVLLDYHIPKSFDGTKEVTKTTYGNLTRYFDTKGKLVYKEETGLFGINNHRAHINIIKNKVGLYSAGCIVQNYPDIYYNDYIPLIKKSVDNWGNSFSFTLVTECAMRQVINLKEAPGLIDSIKPNLTVDYKPDIKKR